MIGGREGEIGDKRGASERASGRVLLIIMRFGKMLFGGIAAVIRAAAAVSRLVILPRWRVYRARLKGGPQVW